MTLRNDIRKKGHIQLYLIQYRTQVIRTEHPSRSNTLFMKCCPPLLSVVFPRIVRVMRAGAGGEGGEGRPAGELSSRSVLTKTSSS